MVSLPDFILPANCVTYPISNVGEARNRTLRCLRQIFSIKVNAYLYYNIETAHDYQFRALQKRYRAQVPPSGSLWGGFQLLSSKIE